MKKESRNQKYPLKKVVGTRKHQNFKSVWQEVLECGHVISQRRDIYGPTCATRRRCYKCVATPNADISDRR